MTSEVAKLAQKNGRMSWAQAFRDIVVTSMNRGQLPVLGMIAVAMLLIWRLPEEKAGELVFSILAALGQGELWAYVFLVLTIGGWYLHSKWMRKMFSAETKRIGREKSDLQSQLAGEKFKSSDRRTRSKR